MRMPSGPRDASQTLYAMAAQAKWRSRWRHQPAEVFSESWCGALSTASTFTSEFRMLKEAPHAPRGYVYASMMLLAGQVAAIPFVASIPSM